MDRYLLLMAITACIGFMAGIMVSNQGAPSHYYEQPLPRWTMGSGPREGAEN